MLKQLTYCVCIALLVLLAILPAKLSAQIQTDDIPNANPGRKSAAKNQQFFFMDLNVGIAVPLSNYGSQNLYNENAAYARPGVNIYVNAGKFFNRYVGVIGAVGYLRHPAHKENIETLLQAAWYPASVTNFNYKGFHHMYGAAGMVLRIPAKQTSAIDIRVQLGYTYGIDKELSYVVTDLSTSYEISFETGRDLNFLINPGVTFRLFATNSIVISTSMDYMFARYKFENITVFNNGIPVDEISYVLPMHNFSVGLSVGFMLD